MYRLDQSIQPNPLIPWLYVFHSLGLDILVHTYDMIDFPVYPLRELSEIAYDFSITYLKLADNSEDISIREEIFPLNKNEKSALNLFNIALSSGSYVSKRDRLFESTFSYLDKIGAAYAVYQWGIQTHTYHKYSNPELFGDLRVLKNWFRFLRIWCVIEIKNSKIAAFHISQFEDILDKYVPIYEKAIIDLAPLDLPIIKYFSMQKIILDTESQIFSLEEKIEKEWQSSTHTKWEEYAYNRILGKGYWIRSEGKIRIYLQAWNKIKDLLSDTELRSLENWVKKHSNQFEGLTAMDDLS